jgi:hypothetical protein
MEASMKPILLTLLALGAITFVAIHLIWYIKSSQITTTADLNARLTDGQPTVVEFYSNL